MPRDLLTGTLLALALAAALPAQELPDLGALRYRCVGPTRGGRVTAVCGVTQRPGTFFFGATGGGVWKTEDYGASWRNVSDRFFRSPSIGAIEVAVTDPDLVWVGTGSDALRSNVIAGRGVYRSTDGGDTWECMGLEAAGQIGAVLIDPTDSDTVFVAAIGNAFAPNEERGVYRTTDGGRSWKRVFFVSPECGAVDLEFHPADPETIYASMWEVERKPWTIDSGGGQGGVWRSRDGGETWHRLAGGLPTGIVGKSDLAVSRADPDRLYVLIEALEGGGLYRSDDRGDSFELVSQRRGLLLRPFYYCNVDCDPGDADHLYVSATGYQESRDGGRTWRSRRTPHGDNHGVWIDPEDPDVMIQCNDGGANVTTDGGKTWSTQRNQPTAELYQVAVDDRFPYWLYAGQQDNSTIRVPSDGDGSDPAVWERVGGCETGPVVPKPGDPDIVYAACKGRFGLYSHRTGQEQQYYVGAFNLYGHNPKDLVYRFARVAPITVSPFDPDVVYHGSQYVHRTNNGGRVWERISPDLTAFEADKQVISGGPITRDITGEEYYSTLCEIAESPVRAGVIWAGANDGPIHVTRDAGRTWVDATPEMPAGGRVQTIEPSRRGAGVAYACILRYQLGDPSPYVYVTEDYGASWRRIVDGLPADCPTRVVREDPADPNVLFLGTEWGVYLSLDAGASWRPLQQNLPVVPVTDLVLHDDDLVLSTMGRSFWILDDISPLRALRNPRGSDAALLPPRTAVRTRLRGRSGANVHYVLPERVDGLRLEIYDLSGDEPRRIRTLEPRPEPKGDGEREKGSRRPIARGFGSSKVLARSAGLHRVHWDLRGTGRFLVPPGEYELRLLYADGESRQRLTVVIDPRVAGEGVSVEDIRAQVELIESVAALRKRGRDLLAAIRKRQGEDLSPTGRERLAALRARLEDRKVTYPRPMALAQLRYLSGMISRADQRPGRDAYERFEQLKRIIDETETEFASVE